MSNMIRRALQSMRWRLGMQVAAIELENGTDESVARFYSDRVTHCEFLDDEGHYEYPRASWVLGHVSGKSLLEIGCGNGGMTRLLASRVDRLTAFDVSAPSLRQVEEMGMPNVETAQGLIESFVPRKRFDWVVMSEVVEHLRKPQESVNKAFEWVIPGGSFVITTPNGHWESDEHLHEFTLSTFSEMLSKTGCESMEVGYLRDRDNRRRWLTAILLKGQSDPDPDDFFNRRAIARKRKQ